MSCRASEEGFLDYFGCRKLYTAAVVVTDLDFADDLAIVTEKIQQSQTMLECLESEAVKVGYLTHSES